MTDDAPPVRDIPEPSQQIGWYAIVGFIGQLALMGLGAWSLWRITGGGWVAAAVAGVFVIAYFALWRIWLAPGSRRRVGFRERTTVMLILGPAVVALCTLGQVWLPALIALSAVLLCDSLAQRNAT